MTKSNLKINTSTLETAVATEEPYDICNATLELGEELLFRMTPEGVVTKGHWINKGKLIPNSSGYRFVIKYTAGFVNEKADGTLVFEEDINGHIGYLLENEDYGWQRTNTKKDDRGIVYDKDTENAQGYNFDYNLFPNIETAIKTAHQWLKIREEQRLRFNNK